MTHAGPLNSFRMQAGHQKNQPCDKKVITLGQPDLRGGGNSWRLGSVMSAIFNQSCLCEETPIKALDIEAQWSFLVGEHVDVPGG